MNNWYFILLFVVMDSHEQHHLHEVSGVILEMHQNCIIYNLPVLGIALYKP